MRIIKGQCEESRRLVVVITAQQPLQPLCSIADIDIPLRRLTVTALCRADSRSITWQRPGIPNDLAVSSSRKGPNIKFFRDIIASLFHPPAVARRWDLLLTLSRPKIPDEIDDQKHC